jgi:hypothetical protein
MVANERRRPGEGPGVSDGATSFDARLATAYAILDRVTGRRLPVHLADQAEAAASDALALLGRISAVEEVLAPGRLHGLTVLDDPHRHRQARILAGVIACTPCWHLRKGGPQPGVVMLPTRRADCARCTQTRRRPVVADNVCDLCDELVADNVFWPVRAQLGVLVVGGDMCRACAAAITPEAAA